MEAVPLAVLDRVIRNERQDGSHATQRGRFLRIQRVGPAQFDAGEQSKRALS
jgi:hypothetical protein